MKALGSLRSLMVLAFVAATATAHAQGVSNTWDTNAPGNWTDATNWLGNTAYAEGADNTATLGDFITADRIITLNAPITIGNVTASDTSNNYTISGANILTLDRTSGVPIIDVTTSGRTLTISSQISGTDGLQKNGAGTLLLSNINNNYTGGTVLSAGALSFSTNSDVYLGATSGALTFSGGQINYSDDFVLNRNVIVNANMALTNRITVNGVLSGTSSISQSGSDGATFANTGNTFTGTITVDYAMTFASLGDSSNAYNFGDTSVGFTWTGGAKTFALRPFTLHTTGNGQIRNNGTGALVIQQNLAITGTAGARSLFLGGSNTTSTNQFAGNIANGTGSVVSLTKEGGNSIWALSGANTYTGATTMSYTDDNGILIFQGMQALSPNTSLNQNQGAFNQRAGTMRFLDDSATPASRSGVNLNFSNIEGVGTGDLRHWMRAFVGNNSVANGGTSSSTQTGSTIQLGNLNLTEGAAASTGGGLWVTGANGYRLQIADVNVTLQVATTSNWQATLRADNPMTVTGTVRQANDAGVGSTTTLQLEGVASGSLISGNIQNSAGGRVLNVSKGGTGDWTLSGTNSYTGGTTITTGTLIFSGANSLPATGTVSVGAAGGLSLADGTARSSTVPALTLTSLAGLSFDWTGSSTGDTLTSTADITPTANSKFAITLNRSGTPAGPLTLLDGGAASTLSSSQFYLANATDYTATLSTPTVDTLVVDNYASATPLTTFYWGGNKLAAAATAGVDNAWALSDGTKSNWSSTTTAYTATALTPGATANVIFANGQVGKTQQSTTLGADVTVNSLTIDDSVAVTVAGKTLTLLSTSSTPGTVSAPGSAISVTSNANATSTVSSNVNLGANQTWNVASGKTLAVSGSVNGAFSLTKGDAGTLTLSGTNTYSGGTIINAGTVNFTNAANLGGTGRNITFGGSATLNGGAGTSTFGVLAVNSGTASFGTGGSYGFASTSGTGSITFNGSNNANVTLDLGSASAFTGTLQNNIGGHGTNLPGKIIQFTSLGDGVGSAMRFGGGDGNGQQAVRFRLYGDAGPLTMTNRQVQLLTRTASSNDFDRAILQNDNANPANKWVISPNLTNTLRRVSTLELRGTNTGDNEFAGAIINSTDVGGFALNLNKRDSGTWILSNASNTFTGTINLDNGTLAYASAGGANPITFSNTTGAATLTYTGAAKTMSGAINAGSVTSGTVNLVASGSGAVNYSNTGTITAAGSGNRNLVLSGTNTGDNILAGAWVNNTGGAATLTKNGVGTWILTGTNTYTGATTVNAGTLLINGDNSAATGAITVASGAVFGGEGLIGGNLALNGNADFWVEDLLDPLAVGGTLSFSTPGFGIASLLNIDWDAPGLVGTYTLVSGTVNFTNVSNVGEANEASVGTLGRTAYFQNGSLELVVVPEPTTMALLGAGVTLLGLHIARRRKA